MARILDWMPVQASTFAAEVDFMNNFISWVAAVCTICITGTMIYFAWKYKKRSDEDITPQITHNATLETLWTAIPTVVVLFVFYYGTTSYVKMRTPPATAIEIGVRGFKYGWEFTYPTGKKQVEELVVPVNKPIKLIMTSSESNPKDTPINHSFFIPAMRVKEDVIGGVYHYLWFEPTKIGTYPIFCTEYCGVGHSGMYGKLRVVSDAEYADHINDRRAGERSIEEIAKELWVNKGCKGCHSLDGGALVGPTWKGLFGAKREFVDGTSAVADENYIKTAINNPAAQIVKGYPNVMPMIPLNDEEVGTIISFMKTLK